jgi:hypothetical protein
MKVRYYSGTYPDDHWVFNENSTPYVVGAAGRFTIKLNPTDSRGYRLIVALGIDRKSVGDGLNRQFWTDELDELAQIEAGVIAALSVMAPIVQTYGPTTNSAHRWDAKSRTLVLGSAKEPLQLCAHILMRGRPKWRPFGRRCAPLGGPRPGRTFRLDKGKRKWDPRDARQLYSVALPKSAKVLSGLPSF